METFADIMIFAKILPPTTLNCLLEERTQNGVCSIFSAYRRGGPSLSTERLERRLAAILAADVAGYSRLMAADEEGTLAQLKAHRKDVIDPKITEHRGRIVKTTGDGMLVEFASVVDALRCAVEVQRGMTERNVDVPQDKRIEFRVGHGQPTDRTHQTQHRHPLRAHRVNVDGYPSNAADPVRRSPRERDRNIASHP